MPPLGLIGPLSRDVVAGAPPRIGGGPWHATRALHTLRQDAVVVAKCGEADRSDYRRQLAALGLPSAAAPNGSTVITPDGVERIPARWIAADPTGAGDAFAVAYLGSRASGHSPFSAARRATALVAALLEAGAQ